MGNTLAKVRLRDRRGSVGNADRQAGWRRDIRGGSISKSAYSIISFMWNIRMRASGRKPAAKAGAARISGENRGQADAHISGAEGIYDDAEIFKIVKSYVGRALVHPKGSPDRIVVTIEKIRQRPRSISALSPVTLECGSPREAKEKIQTMLESAGVSRVAIKNGMAVLTGRSAMRGAAIILAESGRRVEPDKERGVRASVLGIDRTALKSLCLLLGKQGINNTTVKEALILASKVASCKEIMAELCISDDPDYTTGYLASKRLGYVRLPNIKKKGSAAGGRIFYAREDADVEALIRFMEKTPVIISRLSESGGKNNR